MDDGVKDALYAKLEDVYDKCPANDTKIVLGDFNEKVGQEGISQISSVASHPNSATLVYCWPTYPTHLSRTIEKK